MAVYALLLVIPLTANIQITRSNSWYGSKFECVGRNKCYDDQIHCEDNKHCIVDCSGPNACQYAAIHCPKDAKCEVECIDGIDACKDVIFLAQSSSSLSITCDRSQDEACDETVIYCPNNGRSGPHSCKISGVSQINVKTKMEIFAVEGLNDVEITGTYVNNAFLYCGPQYSSTCLLTGTSPFRQCISTDKTCETYLIPTFDPTSYPTLDPTDFPTDQPTPQPNAPSEPTSEPTFDPTDFPTDLPTPQPIQRNTSEPTFGPTFDPTDFPTDLPTPQPIEPTHYPTFEPTQVVTQKPTHSETVKTTKKPTRRPADLSYPTTGPTVATPTSSPKPTRYMGYGSLTTTTSGAFGADDVDGNIDINGVGFQDSEQPQTGKTNLNPLYYVITVLLISICYVSGSLFCWVHYHHKYTAKVIDLKRHSRLQPGVVLQANPMHEPGANQDLLFIDHRNRLASSCDSNVTAPTTAAHTPVHTPAPTYPSRSPNNNIQEEEAQSIAPTSHCTGHSQSQYTHCSENTSEFKEVDYETAMGPQGPQYGEKSRSKYGSPHQMETHSVKESNLSDYNVVSAVEMLTPYDSHFSQRSHYRHIPVQYGYNAIYKEVDYETHNNQCQEDDEYEEDPIQPSKCGIPVYNMNNIGFNGHGVFQSQGHQQMIINR